MLLPAIFLSASDSRLIHGARGTPFALPQIARIRLRRAAGVTSKEDPVTNQELYFKLWDREQAKFERMLGAVPTERAD